MSTQSPDLNAYLDLAKTIEYNSLNNSANLAGYTWLAETSFSILSDLVFDGITAPLNLSTMRGFGAGQFFAFGMEFLGEMLERSGNPPTINPFNSESGLNIPNANFGDRWYQNVAEAFVDSTLDMSLGIYDIALNIKNGNITEAIHDIFGITYISPEALFQFFGGQGQGLGYESAVLSGLTTIYNL